MNNTPEATPIRLIGEERAVLEDLVGSRKTEHRLRQHAITAAADASNSSTS